MLYDSSVLRLGFYVLIFLIFRYTLIAGIAWTVWYAVKRKKWAYKKIQFEFPKKEDYLREIGYSMITFLIFAGMIMFVKLEQVKPYTWMYREIADYGWVYFAFSFILMLFIHDTYFYWTHRLMHHPRLFKLFHLVHHRSTNPSPWAAFSFHPTEAVVEFSIVLIFIFCFPTHPLAILLFLLFMTVYNVYGHLGFELYPKGFHRHPVGKWMNTSVNHNMHHRYFKGNYGLYFTIWDRLMGTMHPQYEQTFEEVTERKLMPTA